MDNHSISTNKSSKKWFYCTITWFIFFIFFFITTTIIIDPCFHYHSPLQSLNYFLDDDRYQGDGIIRNYDYDTIFIGTSLMRCFTPSYWDKHTNSKSIKVTFSDAPFYEVNQRLARAFKSNHNPKTVIRCLDTRMLVAGKDTLKDGVDYPDYLYDDNPINDVSYLLNKSVLAKFTLPAILNKTPITMDDYLNYGNSSDITGWAVSDWGIEYTTWEFAPYGVPSEEETLTTSTQEMVLDNINQNVFALIDDHPETTFYLFTPPYCISYWGGLNNDGKVNYTIDAEQLLIEEALKRSNVKFYLFDNNFDVVTDFDRYHDYMHYDEKTCTEMMEYMLNDQYLLTQENYIKYLNENREFYNSYDYLSLNR